MLTFNSQFPQGRFGNILMQNIGLSVIGKKYNLKCKYHWKDKNGFNYNLDSCLKKNFNFFSEGRILEGSKKLYSDFSKPNIEDLFTKKEISEPIEIESFLQKDCILYGQEKIMNSIIKKNNIEFFDQVFIHVRLGDREKFGPGFNYYKNALKQINFKSGIISSDSPKNKVVQKLIKKYNLSLYLTQNIQEIISNGSKYEYRIITGGSFGWLIGYLGDNNNVYYVKNTYKKFNPFVKQINHWPDELFKNSGWKGL